VAVTDPVTQFRTRYATAAVYDVDDYTRYARAPLEALGWLTHPLGRAVRDTARSTLHGASGQGLDPQEAWAPVLLWVLRLNGHLAPVAGLDEALYDWRVTAEGHAGEPFYWLPSFPEHTS
jgi:hypothetical protein